MREPGALTAGVRSVRLIGLALLALVLTQAAVAQGASGSLSFDVMGSDGHKVSFFGGYDSKGAQVSAFAEKRGNLANYSARGGHVDAHTLEGKIGTLGSVDMKFHATSTERRHFHECKGSILIRHGTFTGSYSFEGEGGYTSAQGHKASGVLYVLRIHDCEPTTTEPGPKPKRDEVVLTSCIDREQSAFYAFAAGGGHGSVYVTEEKPERRGSVSINRYILAERAPETFTYSPNLSEAALTPGYPFTGTGSFSGDALTGDLAASFLGNPTPLPMSSDNAQLKRTRGLSASVRCKSFGETIVVFADPSSRRAMTAAARGPILPVGAVSGAKVRLSRTFTPMAAP